MLIMDHRTGFLMQISLLLFFVGTSFFENCRILLLTNEMSVVVGVGKFVMGL